MAYQVDIRYRDNPKGDNEYDRVLRWHFDQVPANNRDSALLMAGRAFWPNVPTSVEVVAIFVSRIKKSK